MPEWIPDEIRAIRERLGLTQAEAGEWPCWARPPPPSPLTNGYLIILVDARGIDLYGSSMPDDALAPDEIRAIRERLGLTQLEAGDLLGGGPSAFTKYEAGTVKPAAAVSNLLRLLKANPDMIATLRGGEPRSMPPVHLSPFEVNGKYISALTQEQFPNLLRRLLLAEARSHDIPLDGSHVASVIQAPDGGEDGRIEWQGGPARTPFLPGRICQFQMKTGKIAPSTAGREVTRQGKVKEMVRSVLESNGYYTMLCNQPYTRQRIEERERHIRKALREAGMSPAEGQVAFRDADQIADWVNSHPAVAVWVLERTGASPGPFRSWRHWARRAEHSGSPWVEDERLPGVSRFLRERVTKPQSIGRLAGLAGIGKSRLALEAIRQVGGDAHAIYADESEASHETIADTVRELADSGMHAIVVVDSCTPENDRILTGMVSHEISRLSLLTIDDQLPTTTPGETTLIVREAPTSVTDAIIAQTLPGLRSEDQQRLARFSRGFPWIATCIGQAWRGSIPIAHAVDDDLVDAFVKGHNPREPRLLPAATLMAVFGRIGIEGKLASELDEVASLGRGFTRADLHDTAMELVSRGVARKQGRYAVIQPQPIASRLAERQWKSWRPSTWDKVLAGETSLKVRAARQLALLNTTDTAREVAKHVCRFDGPFAGIEGIARPDHAKVLSFLAQIDAPAVVELVERALDGINDLRTFGGDARHNTVWALEKIAFTSQAFEMGAHLLLRLAVAENEDWSNNATGQFHGLFHLYLGGTEASGVKRIKFLDEVIKTDDPEQHSIVLGALGTILELEHYTRFSGAESHGSRPALNSWQPTTRSEARAYIEEGVQRLIDFAIKKDPNGIRARRILGMKLHTLIRIGLIDTVEDAVKQVLQATDYWREALEDLTWFGDHGAENTDEKISARVQALIDALQPQTLKDRVQFLVTEMPWDYLKGKEVGYEAQFQRQNEAVHGLVTEMINHPDTITAVLSRISRGEQRKAYEFGNALANLKKPPYEWIDPIISAVTDVPEQERNFELLKGYITGIASAQPAVVDAFKKRASASSDLAPVLPLICSQIGITPSDIDLVIETLQARRLHPQWLAHWRIAQVPVSVVAPLFDVLIDHSANGFSQALDLMGMYSYGNSEKLDHLRSQILHLIENATRWNWGTAMEKYYFEEIVNWLLDKGKQDRDAVAAALILSKSLAEIDLDHYDVQESVKTVVPKLLSEFPETAWQIIGSAIISGDIGRKFLLENLLQGSRWGGEDANPPILSLPVDTLFAWCHAHPDQAPAFTAKVVPFLENDASGRSVHPVLLRLIEEFGNRPNMRNAIIENLYNGGWSGSEANYRQLYTEPVGQLRDHQSPAVRKWARQTLRDLEAMIEGARIKDAEYDARMEG